MTSSRVLSSWPQLCCLSSWLWQSSWALENQCWTRSSVLNALTFLWRSWRSFCPGIVCYCIGLCDQCLPHDSDLHKTQRKWGHWRTIRLNSTKTQSTQKPRKFDLEPGHHLLPPCWNFCHWSFEQVSVWQSLSKRKKIYIMHHFSSVRSKSWVNFPTAFPLFTSNSSRRSNRPSSSAFMSFISMGKLWGLYLDVSEEVLGLHRSHKHRSQHRHRIHRKHYSCHKPHPSHLPNPLQESQTQQLHKYTCPKPRILHQRGSTAAIACTTVTIASAVRIHNPPSVSQESQAEQHRR